MSWQFSDEKKIYMQMCNKYCKGFGQKKKNNDNI